MTEINRVKIRNESDVVACRRACRKAAKDRKFNLVDQTRITTAASELARNIIEYAEEGLVTIESLKGVNGLVGLRLTFMDKGPGITNVKKAMSEGWTSHRGLGLGLPGAKKLMDDFDIDSRPGKGTKVSVIKWRR